MTTPTHTPSDLPPPAPVSPHGGRNSLIVAAGGMLFAAVAVVGTVMLSGNSNASGGAGGSGEDPELVAAGKIVASKSGCFTCHTDDGAQNRGPTWKGMWGSVVTYDDGSTGIIDDAAIREALIHPTDKIIENFEGIMPAKRDLSEADTTALLAYMRSLSK